MKDSWFANFDVVKILSAGVMGFGFLLAFLAYRLLEKIQDHPVPDQSVLTSVYYFMGFSILLCVIGLASTLLDQRRSQKQCENELTDLKGKFDAFINSRERLTKVGGKIVSPSRGTTVPNTFDCTGTITGFNEGEGVHVWVAVEVNGLIWPKERQLKLGKDGSWSIRVFEDGSGSKFSLVLIAADEAANARIEEWFARGRSAGGKFDSMSMVDGMNRLDRVDNLQLQDK